jgi:hypothetical protein
LFLEGIEAAKGLPPHLVLNKEDLIGRIQRSLDTNGRIYARTMLGFILQKEKDCHRTGDKIIKEIKDALGEDKFKVSLLRYRNSFFRKYIISTDGSR